MSIVDFIAVVSFGLTCFGRGYTFGKDNNKPQKYRHITTLFPPPESSGLPSLAADQQIHL